MLRTIIACSGAAVLLAGCAGHTPRPATVPAPSAPVVVAAPPPAWTKFARPGDLSMLDALHRRFAAARAAVPARFAGRLKTEGPLVDPATVQLLPQLSPGSYHCRLVRLGGKGRFQSFAPDFCYVDAADDRLSFTKQTGTILPEGYVYPDEARRQVFLGTLRVAGGKRGPGYGKDPAQDVVGIVERVAPFRWRLILSRAGRGADLDMYELVPITPVVPPRIAAR